MTDRTTPTARTIPPLAALILTAARTARTLLQPAPAQRAPGTGPAPSSRAPARATAAAWSREQPTAACSPRIAA